MANRAKQQERRGRSSAETVESASALSHSRIFLEAVEQSPAAVVITDPEGRVEYVNPRFREITGYSLEDMIGQSTNVLKSGGMPEAFYEELWKTLRDGREWRGECENRKKNGEVYWESARITPIRDGDGRITHFLKTAEDITSRKKLEAELQESARTVKEREEALRTSYEQLAHATKALKESEQHLRRMAHLDALTGLFNRRGFEQELRRIWALAERRQGQVGVLVIDVDHFKTLNDLHGHAVGDRILRELATLLQTNLRLSDIVCRYGGDEMIVALPLTSVEETRAVADRILQMVRQHYFCRDTLRLRATVSVGATCAKPGPGITPETVLIQADHALYRAKQAGRDRLHYWDAQPSGEPGAEHGAASAEGTRGLLAGRVMIVDDEAAIGTLLTRILQHEGYQTFFFETAREARECMERENGLVDVALLDLNLREENGLDLLRALHHKDDTLIGIVITGVATIDNAVNSLRSGAYDFITKPFDRPTLLATIDRAIRYRHLLLENRKYQLHLEDMVREKSAVLARTLDQLRTSYRFTLEALAAMLDAREKTTGMHSKRVAQMAKILARAMNVPEEQVEIIGQGALLHDIGKIAIPDTILLKEGRLTEDEWKIVKTHPEVGYSILRASPELDKVAEIVLAHQERFDGSGYPRGLKGQEICLGARIFAVVDAYDAIRAHRPYSPSRPPAEALQEIARQRGKQFDPEVVDVLVHCQSVIESGNWWPSEPAPPPAEGGEPAKT